MKNDIKSREADRHINPDRIEDKWRPADAVKEPGLNGEIYITGKKLGKGGFAVCFEGHLEKGSRVYALKVVKSQVEQRKQLEKVSSATPCQTFVANHSHSFAQNYKYTQRCNIPTSSSFSGRFHSKTIPM